MRNWREVDAREKRDLVSYLEKTLPDSGKIKEQTFTQLDTSDSHEELSLCKLAECLFYGGEFNRGKVYANELQIQDDSGVTINEALAHVYLEANGRRGCFDANVIRGDYPDSFDVYIERLKIKRINSESVYTIDSDPAEGVKKFDVLTGNMIGGRYKIYTKVPFRESDVVRYLSRELNLPEVTFLTSYDKFFDLWIATAQREMNERMAQKN